MTQFIDVVFDAPPGPESGRFVEVENDKGESIRIGSWQQRQDGYWVLRIYKGHTHGAGTMIGKHIDECAYCGEDLRHPIHGSENQLFAERLAMRQPA